MLMVACWLGPSAASSPSLILAKDVNRIAALNAVCVMNGVMP